MSKLYYRNDEISISNYSFFHQCKVFEYLRVVMASIYVDNIYKTKLKKFRFLNLINTTLTKIEIITILLINIKIFFEICIKPNVFSKHNIHILQLNDFSYWYKKAARCINIFYIRCNFG